MAATPVPKVLAVASGGGHWVQLNRVAPAWDGCDVHYLTTSADLAAGVRAHAAERGQPEPQFHLCTDANRWQKFRLLRQMLEIAAVVLKVRPDVIVTTGAAPGYFALRIGKLLGARTCWLDSIANAQILSLSGIKAGPYADLYLTQWPDLAEPDGVQFAGAVL